MKKQILLISLIGLFLLNVFGCTTISEQEYSWSDVEFLNSPQDFSEPSTVKILSQEILEKFSEASLEVEEDVQNQSVEEQSVDNYDYSQNISPGLTQESGVNYYNGRTETYYSSNVLYHYRTNEWTVDDEGFYRTNEGYYVVAASDMPQGTIFEGSKGTCIVLDSGCNENITDYYVSWN